MEPLKIHTAPNENTIALDPEAKTIEHMTYQERLQHAVVSGYSKIQKRAEAKQSAKKVRDAEAKKKSKEAKDASKNKAKLAREEKKRLELERKEAEFDRKQAEFELALAHRERARQRLLQKKQIERSKDILLQKMMLQGREERVQRRELESQESIRLQASFVASGERSLWQEVVETRSKDKLCNDKHAHKLSTWENISQQNEGLTIDAARSRTAEYLAIAIETAALKNTCAQDSSCDAEVCKDLASRLEECLFSESIEGISTSGEIIPYEHALLDGETHVDQGNIRKYSARARALVRGMRLEENKDVLSLLLQGRVTTSELLTMESSGQLLSEKCRKRKALMVADALAKAEYGAKTRRTLDPYSDKIQCPQCESWGAYYERIPHAGGHHLGKTPSLGGPTGAKITCECASCEHNFRTEEPP